MYKDLGYKNTGQNCGTQARKGKGGPRVEKKRAQRDYFSGVPGGIPIPFFAVAGTRTFGLFKVMSRYLVQALFFYYNK